MSNRTVTAVPVTAMLVSWTWSLLTDQNSKSDRNRIAASTNSRSPNGGGGSWTDSSVRTYFHAVVPGPVTTTLSALLPRRP